ncbi:hypothetical protein HYW99_01805 [Candidatus Woesearchaeota archaeon]|nr:hypothetical protein [Candidatus Woesearchaeota archaeon]
MDTTCYEGYCTKCHAFKWVVFGIVLFLVTWYAKASNNVYLIWYALAVLLVLKGIMKFSMPACSHCQPSTEAKKVKK